MLNERDLPERDASPSKLPVKEVQRKFLVDDLSIIEGLSGEEIRQGYIHRDDGIELKIRIKDESGFVTIKGEAGERGKLRFTYPIPTEHAQIMLESYCAGELVEKTRYAVDAEGLTWDVDVFHGSNKGLAVAELDLDAPRSDIIIPSWIGEEISGQKKYGNASLSKAPISSW